ncbi:uncharacterized protein PV09_08210 [Verruconis gallopava]|uniref:Uncharacterized protein n=1 Tax=Verruconis gallopava TaxID=253628 RepID=A0A0D2A0J8_9PEZI|nr:uncharacterized protein PV09_08210 [Verruconis gallopava]KIW00168.1 hypothetical protein PV09_08210 [Verruconis gallopava]
MQFTISFVQSCALSLSLSFVILAQDCTMTVPANPLSATGLATPYTVTGCDQRQFADQGSFVEASIYDPATSQITIYHPLVVNQGDVVGKDFIKPVAATVPQDATVAIYFGSNANTLTLTGPGASSCVNGLPGSIFGQFAHCNGDVFMNVTQAAITAGSLRVPTLGIGKDGQQCPTTRDFRIVDMDQSDNVDTQYLLINNHTLAQATTTNKNDNPDAEVLTNASDNALVNDFIDPVLGCTPWMVTSPTAIGGKSPALSLNELQGFKYPPSSGPAFVPLNDDMCVITDANGNIQQSLQKTNLYRAGVGQPQAAVIADASGTTYCQKFTQSGLFIAQNQALFKGKTSPAPATAVDLYTFLAQRFAQSFGPAPALGCTTIFGLANNPVTLKMDGNGVVTAATINTQILQSILSGATNPGGASSGKTTATTSVTATSGTGTIKTRTGTRTETATTTPSISLKKSVSKTTRARKPTNGGKATSNSIATVLPSTLQTSFVCSPTLKPSAAATLPSLNITTASSAAAQTSSSISARPRPSGWKCFGQKGYRHNGHFFYGAWA